jgi:hypothetical protein
MPVLLGGVHAYAGPKSNLKLCPLSIPRYLEHV